LKLIKLMSEAEACCREAYARAKLDLDTTMGENSGHWVCPADCVLHSNSLFSTHLLVLDKFYERDSLGFFSTVLGVRHSPRVLDHCISLVLLGVRQLAVHFLKSSLITVGMLQHNSKAPFRICYKSPYSFWWQNHLT
jgi:hypothetical protein